MGFISYHEKERLQPSEAASHFLLSYTLFVIFSTLSMMTPRPPSERALLLTPRKFIDFLLELLFEDFEPWLEGEVYFGVAGKSAQRSFLDTVHVPSSEGAGMSEYDF